MTVPDDFGPAVARFIEQVEDPHAADEALRVACAVAAVDGTVSTEEDHLIRSVFPDAVSARSTEALWAKGWLSERSVLFDRLLAADRVDGGTRAWRYHEAGMAVALAVAACESETGRVELEGVECWRRAHLGGLASLPPERDRVPAELRPPAASPHPASPGQPPLQQVSQEPEPIEELLAELYSLTGLDEVKAIIEQTADVLRIDTLRRQHGLPVPDRTHHLVFVGNPGTGKTTVARLLARIYRTLGVLSKGHLVETDRNGLVAGYVGQTAARTVDKCAEAAGGVLLIDEAYSLTPVDSPGDFGSEAIAALVKEMEDRRDDLVVVVTGYPDEMGRFIESNPGLGSRFPKTVTFSDYSTDELLSIFNGFCDRNGYTVDATARSVLAGLFEAADRGRGFGNARLARNVFEEATGRQASRLVAVDGVGRPDLMRLDAADLSVS